MNILRKYDRDIYVSPLWEGDTVYNESVMFMDTRRRASLLFPIDEVYAVLSPDLKTEYKKGVDYDVVDGDLVMLEGSSMVCTPESEYLFDEEPECGHFGTTVEGKKFIRYGEADTFFSRQVFVTYRHSAKWEGYIPEKAEKFSRFLEKCKKGEKVTVLYYGDSITTGCNSSDWIGIDPHAEMWPVMVTEQLKKLTGNPNIEYVNTAVGGMESIWGRDHAEERVAKYDPDLVVFAFGMNDGWKTPEEFVSLQDATIAKMGDCEVCTVATMLPHKRVAGFWCNQCLYEAEMLKYAEDKPNVAVARMTSVHSYLLERKEYFDMTGNNVNHPNDFLARAYAMTVLKTIVG